jgi:hypothetical protein
VTSFDDVINSFSSCCLLLLLLLLFPQTILFSYFVSVRITVSSLCFIQSLLVCFPMCFLSCEYFISVLCMILLRFLIYIVFVLLIILMCLVGIFDSPLSCVFSLFKLLTSGGTMRDQPARPSLCAPEIFRLEKRCFMSYVDADSNAVGLNRSEFLKFAYGFHCNCEKCLRETN